MDIQINELRSNPKSAVVGLQKWLGQFVDDRVYANNGVLFKLKDDKSIIHDAIEYLQGVQPAAQLVTDAPLCKLCQLNAQRVLQSIKLKTHHIDAIKQDAAQLFIELKYWGKCVLVIGDQAEIPFAWQRLVCEDEVPNSTNKRLLFDPHFKRLGTGMAWPSAKQKMGHGVLVLLFSD